jgi:hypothetical protein
MHTILEDVRGQAGRLRWSCIQDVIVKREVEICGVGVNEAFVVGRKSCGDLVVD